MRSGSGGHSLHRSGPAAGADVKQRIDAFIETHGEVPKTVYMQNHGFIALGDSPRQVENITAMAVKAARVLVGAYSLGGPHFALVCCCHPGPTSITASGGGWQIADSEWQDSLNVHL
ncbi:MAG: hypothetical protein R2844_13375 [Caldilineales bacterium]